MKMATDEKVAACIATPMALLMPFLLWWGIWTTGGFARLAASFGEWWACALVTWLIPLLVTGLCGLALWRNWRRQAFWIVLTLLMGLYWFGFFAQIIHSAHWYLGMAW